MYAQDGLDLGEGEAASLIIQQGRVPGLRLASGERIESRAVILCTGTFLGGTLFRGEERMVGGRVGEASAQRLAAQLREAELPMARLKTGTPPRLDGRTIDWAKLEEQTSDADAWTMSPLTPQRSNPQLFCAITRTNRRSMHHSGNRIGRRCSRGHRSRRPRYCPRRGQYPSLGDRDGHRFFLARGFLSCLSQRSQHFSAADVKCAAA